MFTPEQRDRIRAGLLDMARRDHRIVAAAQVGSSAGGAGDRWSDLDLTFGVAEGADVADVLDDWTARLDEEHAADHLFDLPFLSTVYRVFLFPGNLQVDLSFTPSPEFGALGPKFQLLFGDAVERALPSPPSVDELFGLGAHHAVRARVCIERGSLWQAEYWISGVRDKALTLACARRGLEIAYGRGFDRLPPGVLKRFEAALVTTLSRDDLLRALRAAIEGLIAESSEARAAGRIGAQLTELADPPGSPIVEG